MEKNDTESERTKNNCKVTINNSISLLNKKDESIGQELDQPIIIHNDSLTLENTDTLNYKSQSLDKNKLSFNN